MNKYIQFVLNHKELFKQLLKEFIDFLKVLNKVKNEYEREFNKTEWVSWVIDDIPQSTDYIVWIEWWEKLLDTKNPYKQLIEFNQNKGIHKWSCTIFACIWMVNYNTWLSFKQTDVEKWSKYFIDKWIIKPGKGAYISRVVDEFRRILRDVYKEDVIYLTIPIKSDLFEKALNNWWSFEIGYRTSKEKLRDTQEDWIEDNCEYPKVWWHAVWIRKVGWELEVVNSYKWILKYNRYKFKEGLKQLRCEVDKWIYFPYARIIMKKENIQPNPDIRLVEEAIERWITKDKQLLEDIKKWNYTWKVQTVLMIMRAMKQTS